MKEEIDMKNNKKEILKKSAFILHFQVKSVSQRKNEKEDRHREMGGIRLLAMNVTQVVLKSNVFSLLDIN